MTRTLQSTSEEGGTSSPVARQSSQREPGGILEQPARPIVALIVLDGWGIAPPGPGNAIALANTPVFDLLTLEYPMGLLQTSGGAVGLPPGQMGNSEVGHLNLGAGFVVKQELVRLGDAIDSGSFFEVEALTRAFEHAAARGGKVHLLGLIGEGGVHAHTRHLVALLELARRRSAERVYIHAFTDGRDSAPTSGAGFVADLLAAASEIGVGQVATVSGRYYAMDRDGRWDRTRKAWAAMVDGVGQRATDPIAAIEESYAHGTTDEFILPTVIVDATGAPTATIEPGDALVMFNFRADRMRQLLRAFTEPGFNDFPRELPRDLYVATMTEYFPDGQLAPVAFEPIDVEWPVARVVAAHSLRQFHTAETEKYAHVTYFFNGGRETPFAGEDRSLVPSPRVATYDLAPEMSAGPVTEGLVERILTGVDGFAIVNYANADMVGHTGDLEATIKAVELVDECLGLVVAAIDKVAGFAVITADHGNADMMIDPVTGGPHTAHTTNPTPLIVVGPGMRLDESGQVSNGVLSDVATTVLSLMGIDAPETMTGRVLALPRGDAGSTEGVNELEDTEESDTKRPGDL